MIDDIEKSHGLTQEISEAFCNSARSEIDKNEVSTVILRRCRTCMCCLSYTQTTWGNFVQKFLQCDYNFDIKVNRPIIKFRIKI